MGKKLLIFLVIFLTGLFFGLKNVKAVEPPSQTVVINEVLANASNDETNHEITNLEWFELYNPSVDPFNLNGSKIEIYNSVGTKTKTIEISNDLFLSSRDYLIFVKDWSLVKSFWNLEDSISHYVASFSLVNSGGKIKLILPATTQEFIWDKDVGDSISMEIIGPPYDDGYKEWLPSATPTPGAQNMASRIKPPKKPNLTLPRNGTNFIVGDGIEFDWDKENDIIYEFWLSKNQDMSGRFGLEDIEYFEPGTYYWQVTAGNLLYPEVKSDIYSFVVSEPIYSSKIIINEIMANPSGDETTGEWIEFFNNSSGKVNLKGWILEDMAGTIHKYIIDEDLWINPYGYLLIYRSQSGITLNNDSDGVRLYQPNGKLLVETSFLKGGKEGWSWARGPDNKWSWTEKPTPSKKNIISLPIEESTEESKVEKQDPINTTPIEIKTGDYQDYLDKLVKITGKVTSTSGNTFYLDDGSGEVKIYIQEKTGIDKPEMHKNDIFEIIGIVDLYGKTWRILPQKQDDIKLIESAPKVVKSSTAKSTAKKSSSSTAVKSIGTAASIGPKKVEAANSSPPSENSPAAAKSPFWIQLLKALLGLAIILLIIFIIKLRQRPKEKVLGGHFGDDT